MKLLTTLLLAATVALPVHADNLIDLLKRHENRNINLENLGFVSFFKDTSLQSYGVIDEELLAIYPSARVSTLKGARASYTIIETTNGERISHVLRPGEHSLHYDPKGAERP